MFDKIKQFLFGSPQEGTTVVPAVVLEGHPFEINPTVSQKAYRSLSRLRNLLLAIEQGDTRPELNEAVEMQIALLFTYGIRIPANVTASEVEAYFLMLKSK